MINKLQKNMTNPVEKTTNSTRYFYIYDPETDDILAEYHKQTPKQAAQYFFMEMLKSSKKKGDLTKVVTVSEDTETGFPKFYKYECSRKKLNEPQTIDYLVSNSETDESKKYKSLEINGEKVVLNYSIRIRKIPNDIVKYGIEIESDTEYKSVKSDCLFKASQIAIKKIIKKEKQRGKKIEFYLSTNHGYSHIIATKNKKGEYVPKLITKDDLIKMMMEKINKKNKSKK
ncbi:hypothetical protein QJ850_gp072 [Acanthamoeba polyphaga mimivirus]|uniref:Uncharacterized protein n=1 Tax=Acanthamoeba polyphaga mimivirus Kroon TaxID=3069720 RepID=A0A0G2Y9V4_9VIRU|nr:hypothetical protein QJ850_gp072 [Acanthamoeba polyphaga mimivirus]AKI80627.1 hypothetical protein [Acanthamoeba polyphaga mimivirus Kroon]